MPVDLVELVAPAHTAVLTMETQKGVVGAESPIRVLADEVAANGMLERMGRLCRAARAAGAPVVHCTAEFRADRAGSSFNIPLLARLAKGELSMVGGSPAAEVVDELGPEPTDLVSPRLHGISPFTGTSLDQWLRNLGVTTVVATGVSVNLGVLGMCVEAADLGYRIVVPVDAVAGFPRDYAQAVLDNTIALLATRATVDEVIAAWRS
ncbi:MAG: isochorismatase hydrolase [Acidimicrobiales bacterium]|nr:isochorismatase hydrolase [Acidimicrobiales bacterium]